MADTNRCEWSSSDRDYMNYHDTEWGVPVHDDRLLFEMLSLEGAQAGLSWRTVLRKRNNYRRLFDDFNAKKIVDYDDTKLEQLLNDPGIIRNRLKIGSVVTNARALLDIQDSFGTFDKYLWQFIDFQPRQNNWRNQAEVPTYSNESDAMSTDLKKRGFKFVGSTICYAFMQAVGMVNDHTIDCFRHAEIRNLGKQERPARE